MKKMEEIKKAFEEKKPYIAAVGTTALLLGGIGGYIGLCVWEHKNFKTIPMNEWKKLTGDCVFDPVRVDAEIKQAFATVEYADGSIGIVDDIIGLAECIAKRDSVNLTIM